MVKDKHIISELNGFFHKNDCNKAINNIMTTIRHLNLRSSCIGIEKRHNCKLSCLQVLELLLFFPFFMVKNSFQYHHSGLSKLFSCQKDMFYLIYIIPVRGICPIYPWRRNELYFYFVFFWCYIIDN